MRWFVLIFLLGPRFEGCGGEEPGDTPLPREEVEVCFSDVDCESAECVDVRCLAGSCIVVADVLDRDGDGDPPLRCGGTDCNDDDGRIYSGARETCNGVDEDCDGRIDEGAPGETRDVRPPVFDPSGVILPWGGAFAITDNQPGAIFAWPVALDGSIGDPLELMRLRRGSAFREIHAATNEDETLVLALTDIGAVLYAILREDEVVEDGDVEHMGQVVALALAPHQDDFAIAADIQLDGDPPEVRRVVRTRRDAMPLDVGFGGLLEAQLDLASTGTDVVVPVEEGLRFVEASSTIARPEGTARRPLASAEDRVVVGFFDGFGLAVQHHDLSGALGTPQPGPSTRTDQTDLAAITDGIGIFGRTDVGSRGAWVLDDTLTRYVRTFIDLGTDEGAISAASQTNASAYYGAGAVDPRITLLLECE